MNAGRETGQRWLSWVNTSGLAVPPFAVIGITGTRVVDTRVVFEAEQLPFNSVSDPLPEWENGVPWFAAFNDENPVEPDAEGFCTVDLPAWCLITESLGVMDFASYRGSGTGQEWSLHTLPDTVSDIRYWNGFRVLATRYLPELVSVWNAKQPGFLQGNFKIGFVGGLTMDLSDNIT